MELIWRDILVKIYRKEETVAQRNAGKIPYSTDGNFFDDRSEDICWWTNGFWAGLLWQLYGVKKNALFRKEAERVERKLDRNFTIARGMDHDSGFKWLLTAGANALLTGSGESKNRLLLAANDLAGRFNPAGNFLRAWNDPGDGTNAGIAIIDCMMNLPLLYRASGMTGDPRFRAIAVRHAETARKYFVREDGSCAHIAQFDPETGEFLGTLGGQGMAVGSSWTRGQSWAIYGFALSYRHTRREQFLATSERVAHNFMECIPKNGYIPVDFCQEQACDAEDDSAAAIASCGLLELFRITGKEEYLKPPSAFSERSRKGVAILRRSGITSSPVAVRHITTKNTILL